MTDTHSCERPLSFFPSFSSRIHSNRRHLLSSQLYLRTDLLRLNLCCQTFRDGMDFYFSEKQQALRFIDFVTNNIPTRSKYARKLVSADHSSNIANFKHNHIVEIVPLCKVFLIQVQRNCLLCVCWYMVGISMIASHE